MSDTLHVIKRPYGGLVPARPYDEDVLAKYPSGATLRIEIARLSRSAKAERWYRALLKKVADGIGVDPGALHTDLKFRTKRVESFTVIKDVVRVVPISNADMDYAEFRRYLDDAIDVLLAEIVPGMKRGDLLAEVAQMTGTSLDELTAPEETKDPESEQQPSPPTSPDDAGEPQAARPDQQADHGRAADVLDVLRRYHKHLSSYSGMRAGMEDYAKPFWRDTPRPNDKALISAIFTEHVRRVRNMQTAEECDRRVTVHLEGVAA